MKKLLPHVNEFFNSLITNFSHHLFFVYFLQRCNLSFLWACRAQLGITAVNKWSIKRGIVKNTHTKHTHLLQVNIKLWDLEAEDFRHWIFKAIYIRKPGKINLIKAKTKRFYCSSKLNFLYDVKIKKGKELFFCLNSYLKDILKNIFNIFLLSEILTRL